MIDEVLKIFAIFDNLMHLWTCTVRVSVTALKISNARLYGAHFIVVKGVFPKDWSLCYTEPRPRYLQLR